MPRLRRNDALSLLNQIELGLAPSNLDSWLLITGRDVDFEPRPAREPTSARPGSLEKIEALRQRVAAGESLWHPLDDGSPGEPRERVGAYRPAIREVELVAEVA